MGVLSASLVLLHILCGLVVAEKAKSRCFPGFRCSRRAPTPFTPLLNRFIEIEMENAHVAGMSIAIVKGKDVHAKVSFRIPPSSACGIHMKSCRPFVAFRKATYFDVQGLRFFDASERQGHARHFILRWRNDDGSNWSLSLEDDS